MTGYEKVANFMSDHDEMVIFKRFKFLNILDALYRQAELEHLEIDMKGYMRAGFPPGESEASDSDEEPSEEESEGDNADCAASGSIISDEETTVVNSPSSTDNQASGMATSHDPPHNNEPVGSIQMESLSPGVPKPPDAAVDWWYLANRHENKDAWNTMLEVRQKLKEYSPWNPAFDPSHLTSSIDKTILIQKRLHAISSPHKHDLSFFRKWLQSTTMGDRPIWGEDEKIWTESLPSDLIALSPPKYEDPLGLFLLESTSTWWHSCIGRRIKKPVDEEMQYLEYRNEHILTVATGLSSALSSLLLVASILVLHFVTNMLVRLGVIAIFTTVFSFALILVTNARKVEVFAGTTA